MKAELIEHHDNIAFPAFVEISTIRFMFSKDMSS